MKEWFPIIVDRKRSLFPFSLLFSDGKVNEGVLGLSHYSVGKLMLSLSEVMPFELADVYISWGTTSNARYLILSFATPELRVSFARVLNETERYSKKIPLEAEKTLSLLAQFDCQFEETENVKISIVLRHFYISLTYLSGEWCRGVFDLSPIYLERQAERTICPNGHMFHPVCIKKWHGNCPNCRANISS